MNSNWNVYVTPCEYIGKDSVEGPTPQQAGLEEGREYLVLSLDGNTYHPDAEAYFAVLTDNGEVWYISNRHLRITRIFDKQLNRPLHMISADLVAYGRKNYLEKYNKRRLEELESNAD